MAADPWAFEVVDKPRKARGSLGAVDSLNASPKPAVSDPWAFEPVDVATVHPSKPQLAQEPGDGLIAANDTAVRPQETPESGEPQGYGEIIGRGALAGTIETARGLYDFVPLLADTLNKYTVNPILELAGQKPLPSTGRLPGSEALENMAQKIRPRIAKKAWDDIHGVDETARYLAAKVSELAPQMAPMFGAGLVSRVRGGVEAYLGTMGAMSAGQQYSQNITNKVAPDRAMADAWINGATEALSEYLPFDSILKLKHVVRKLPPEAGASFLGAFMRRAGLAGLVLGSQAGVEAGQEVTNQIAQNLSRRYVAGDKRVQWNDGLAETAAISGVFGGLTAAPVAGLAASQRSRPPRAPRGVVDEGIGERVAGDLAANQSQQKALPDAPLTVTPEGDVGRPGEVDAVQRARVQRRRDLGLTPDVERAQAQREASNRQQQGADQIPVGPTVEVTPSGSRVVDQPTPEAPETLKAQMRAFRQKRKPGVLFTPGEPIPKLLPKGAKSAEIPGRGTLIYRDDATLKAAQEGRMGEALGYGVPEKPAGAIEVITARDESGTPVQDVAVTPETAASVTQAAEQVAGPKGSVEVRPADEALAERAEATQTSVPKAVPATPDTIDAAANEAATSPTNDLPEPTQAQKEAGNYRVGKVRLHGLDISIENPKGSSRSGVDKNGKTWSRKLTHHYGYIRGAKDGADGDALDVFLGPHAENADLPVYVVDQVDPDSGKFDEHKIVMGTGSEAEARKAYLSNYDKGWKGLGAITRMSLPEFKDWVANGNHKKPVSDAFKAKAPAATKTVERPKQQKPVSPKQAKAREFLGAGVGDVVVPSGDIGYSKADNRYRITDIGKDGSVAVKNPDTGAGTWWSRAEQMAAQRRGVTFKKEPKPNVSESKFTLTTRKDGTLQVTGDKAAIRAAVKAAGIDAKGIPSKTGIVFGKSQVEQLDNQILAVLREDHPQSVRHVFYRMTDPRLPEPVEKSERGYRHVQERVVKLRRARKLPFGWITDATRRGYHTPTYRDKGDFLRSMKGYYRADLWQQAEFYCEVWTESRSIAGVIEDDCEELAVSLYPAGGFSSITLAYESAEAINYYADGRPVVIFYIGDYDPAGVLIDVALERELREHLSAEIDLRFERIAISPDQIDYYDLPTKPRKETDRRALHIRKTVEAEAMPARILRELLRSNIEALLPERALAVAKVEEESARNYFDVLAEMVGGAA